MKKLFDIIPSNLSSALGWTLIHALWQGIAIVLIFSILRSFFKPSNTRYWLGMGALSLQLLAAIVTFFIIYEPAQNLSYLADNQTFTGFSAQISNLVFTPQKLSLLQQIEAFLQNNLDLFVTVWLIGTSFLLLRLVVGFAYVQGLKVQKTNSVNADIQALMNSLLEKVQFSNKIKLLESVRATVPMTIGWLKPVILLPVGIATGLTVRQLEAILAHELAHIKRYDYFVNIFQNIIEILFFFHPATWFISAKVRDERENCCDDFAVKICGDSMVLAHALTQVASYQQQPRLAMAFGAKRQNFMDRIKRIIGINTSQSNRYGNFSAVLGIILVVALGVVVAQKVVVKEGRTLDENIISAKSESKLDFYFFEIDSRNVGVYKNFKEEIEKILIEGREVKGKEFEQMKAKVLTFFKNKDANFSLVSGITLDEMEQIQNQFFFQKTLRDSTSIKEVEAEMERLSKEIIKYSEQMEVYSKFIEERGGRQMDKIYREMAEDSRKMEIPQRKIQDLSIQLQAISLEFQKIAAKFKDRRELPIDVEQTVKNLEKKGKELESKMQVYEQEMLKIDAGVLPFDNKMNSLKLVVDSLSQLTENHSRPIDSLSKLIEEKSKVLEKLAKVEETKTMKVLRRFTDFLINENLIKDRNNFKVRLNGDILLIDSQPQSADIYRKVFDWLKTDKDWNQRLGMKYKDFTINVKGENVYMQGIIHGNRYYHRSSDFVFFPKPLLAPSPTSPVSLPKPPKPVRVENVSPPTPPKVVKVQVSKAYFNLTRALIADSKGTKSVYTRPLIFDNKGTCSIYIITKKNGKNIAKALPANIGTGEEWTAQGLKAGDLIVIESKEKLKNGDEVSISGLPKIGQIWQTPQQRSEAVMGNADAEFERNEEGRDTPIYENPLLLNGQPLDYGTFSIKSKGVLTLMKGKPTSTDAVKIPFRIYLRRNGIVIYEKKSATKLTQIEISEVLALSKVGDQIIINPTEKVDYKAKRIINVLF